MAHSATDTKIRTAPRGPATPAEGDLWRVLALLALIVIIGQIAADTLPETPWPTGPDWHGNAARSDSLP